MSGESPIEPKASMHYFSTVRGITGGSENGLVYIGVTFRIPASVLGTQEQIAFEEMYDPLVIFLPDEDSEPAFDVPMERYEIRDIEGGDVVVMYRMPYRAKGEANKETEPETIIDYLNQTIPGADIKVLPIGFLDEVYESAENEPLNGDELKDSLRAGKIVRDRDQSVN